MCPLPVRRPGALPIASGLALVGSLLSLALAPLQDLDQEVAEIYEAAIGTLLARNHARGPIYIADRVRTSAGGWRTGSDLAGQVVRLLAGRGIEGRVLPSADAGVHAPGEGLFFVLGEVRFGPSNRIAEFALEVGSGERIHSRAEFTLKMENGAWRVLDWEVKPYR